MICTERTRSTMLIKTREINDIAILDVEGEIRRSEISGMTLHELVKAELERGKRKILLNFEHVGFVDSFGVGEILGSLISIQNLGGELKLARVTEYLRSVFMITGLIQVLDIHESEESALAGFTDR
jgi:anti-anti-sigma factor